MLVFSYLQLPPVCWFLPAVLLLGYFLYPRVGGAEDGFSNWGVRVAILAVVLAAVAVPANLLQEGSGEQHWSPYYRIDYEPTSRIINVNLIGHQQMVPRAEPYPAYALPHLLTRDSGAKPFKNVLIVGRRLRQRREPLGFAPGGGREHIDAVEIDPAIQRIGQRDNPDKPYQDPRVTVHLGDGRNFLRSTDKQYDLIIYALVDSLVLHSSYSNIRLESYLFTSQAFEDVKKRLKPDGLFVMYNFFRQGWIVARLEESLIKEFGTRPLVLTLPYLAEVEPAKDFSGFTLFMAGRTAKAGPNSRGIPQAAGAYWIRLDGGGSIGPPGTCGRWLFAEVVGAGYGASASWTSTMPLNRTRKNRSGCVSAWRRCCRRRNLWPWPRTTGLSFISAAH